MTKWNPKQHQENAAPQKEFNDVPVPAGNYLLGATWIDKRPGAKWVKLRFTVLHGPSKGGTVFAILPINVMEKEGSANKVYHYLNAMGRGDVDIDFDKESSVAAAFLGAALKAKVTVSRTRRGEKVFTNHELAKFATLAQCSEAEKEVMEAWNETQAAKGYGQDDSDEFSDGAFADDDPFDFDEGGAAAAPAPAPDGFAPDDDDIPF